MFGVGDLSGMGVIASPVIITLANTQTQTTNAGSAPLGGSSRQLALYSDTVRGTVTVNANVYTATSGSGSNFTVIGTTTTTGTAFSASLSHKVLNDNDIASNYSTTAAGTLNKILMFLDVQGMVGAPTSVNGQATTGNPSVQTITPNSTYGIGVAVYASSGAVSPRTSSITATNEVNNSTNHYIKLFIFDTVNGAAPTSFTVDMDDEGTNVLKSCWIPVT